MHHAAKHIAGLGVALLDVLPYGLDQRGVAGLVALHYLAGRFVDHNYVVVFIYYLHVSGVGMMGTGVRARQ